jgi:hypothetical protein
MKYEVDGWNNFCRVFELPENYPSDFCFGGGHPVSFQMVDWFNPVPGIGQPGISKEEWREKLGEIEVKEITTEELRESLIPWLLEKSYVKPGREYLVLCDFGAVLQFSA